MAVVVQGMEPDFEHALRRFLEPLERMFDGELYARARWESSGARILEIWRWNERVATELPASVAELRRPIGAIGLRLESAHRSGLLRDALDVLDHMERHRVWDAGGLSSGVLRFCYRLSRAEAIARLALTGRRGLLFLDNEFEENAILVLLDDGWALVRESALHLDTFDAGSENVVELECLDEVGVVTGTRHVAIGVLPTLPSVEDGLRAVSKRGPDLMMGRDPGSAFPFLAHRSSPGRIDVYDYLVHTSDVELKWIDGFPPAELVAPASTGWRESLCCPECRRDLPWSEGGLQCACGAFYPVRESRPHFLVGETAPPTPHDKELWAPNPKPKVLLYFVLKYPGGIVIDCGAGDGSFRAPNLVNLEIFPFDSIDIVADGQRLPFRDDSVDAILSAAVLEHVPNPFSYCAELHRVLKHRGEVRIDSAFLQPYHACPDHYFATTKSGLAEVARGFRSVGLGVGPSQSPFVAMQTWLAAFAKRLPDEESARHFYATTVGELLSAPPGPGPTKVRVRPEAASDVAAGVYLHGVKE